MIKKTIEIPVNIMSYIKDNAHITVTNKYLWDVSILLLVAIIPTALFGVYTEYTRPIYLLLTISCGIWVLIVTNKKSSPKSFFLLEGVIFLIFSITLFLAAYKFFSWIGVMTIERTLFLVVLYIFSVLVSNYINLKLICNGYYTSVTNYSFKSIGIITIGSGLGIIIAKSMIGKVDSNKQVVFILGTLLILLGCIMSFGTHLLMKYYFITKLKMDDEAIISRVPEEFKGSHKK
ncbi:hypothetical protein [Alkaliphilus hydrothermalis]|uniref:Uncharacterized protein n=1 Tax=Alkaliphilus hydrothermalis TaxID=1482730 RepID=A0ABS2NQN8_9FIRM|nr:hypothetical protein [Alkaliphilus hydrothermalis]MBM7615107.1 hypothetical protein [Alkaliphilus hydrothermalis]